MRTSFMRKGAAAVAAARRSGHLCGGESPSIRDYHCGCPCARAAVCAFSTVPDSAPRGVVHPHPGQRQVLQFLG
jgi:hypothetical protein